MSSSSSVTNHQPLITNHSSITYQTLGVSFSDLTSLEAKLAKEIRAARESARSGRSRSDASPRATFLTLSDTFDTFLPDAILYTSNTGDALTASPSFVYEDNKLGLGSSTPSETLSVNGNANITGYLTLDPSTPPAVTASRLYNSAGDLYWAGSLIGGATTGNWTTDGTHVWRTSGNVGIANTSPAYPLDVTGAGRFTGLVDASHFIATSSTLASSFPYSSSTALSVSGTAFINALSSASAIPLTEGYTLRGSSGNTAEATSSLFVSASGNVGVGTVSPVGKLEISNGALQISDGAGSYSGFMFNTTDGLAQTNNNLVTLQGALHVNSTNGSHSYILGTGNVGIGLTAPAYKLEVNGSASTTNFYLPNTTSSALGVIYKGTDRFIHNYADPTSDGYNTFVGVNAGNFTMGPAGGASSLGSYNTAVGHNALAQNTTGYHNTAQGYAALVSNTTGIDNTAGGHFSLYYNTTGSDNTANGLQSLLSNRTGNYNTANGVNALFYNQSATNTTALGYAAGYGTGNYSNQGGVYVGYAAGYSAGTGSDYNHFIGYEAGYNTIDGTYNTALGYRALYSATSSDNAVAIGREALYNHLNAQGSVAIGYRALYAATSSDFNTAIGNNALSQNTTGGDNTAIGSEVLYFNTTGFSNTAQGRAALYSNTTGYNNTANGVSTLYSNTTGNYNTALGRDALFSNTTGSYNTANGFQALYANTTGAENTVNGVNALRSNITGTANTAFGVNALYHNQSATNTTALGYYTGNGTNYYSNQGGVYVGHAAGYSAGTGSDYNTMLGYQSGYGVTTGANNILLGYNAGYSGTNLTTGSNNIIIGHNIGATSTDQTRGLNIGNLIFGTGLDGSGTTLSTGNVGIGSTTPGYKLSVSGDVYATSFIDDGITISAPDYVFDDPYYLHLSLDDIEAYIDEHQHLPWLTPRGSGAMSISDRINEVLEALENLFLKVFELDERVDEQDERYEAQQAEIETLKAEIRALKTGTAVTEPASTSLDQSDTHPAPQPEGDEVENENIAEPEPEDTLEHTEAHPQAMTETEVENLDTATLDNLDATRESEPSSEPAPMEPDAASEPEPAAADDPTS